MSVIAASVFLSVLGLIFLWAIARLGIESERLSIVLLLLSRDGIWMRGLEIVRQSDDKVSRVSVYWHLQALEDAGHIESRSAGIVHGIEVFEYRLRRWRGPA